MSLPSLDVFNFVYASLSNIIRYSWRVLVAITFAFTLAACGGGSSGGGDSGGGDIIVDEDTTAPVITLNGDALLTIALNSIYTELGATANDETDGEVEVTISGEVITTEVGAYTITYTATDAASNTATVTRNVNVVDSSTPVVDTTAPVITLIGDAEINVKLNSIYTELGATANDETDGEVEVTISGDVITTEVGVYTITYTANDAADNIATATRTVNVLVDTAPVITLNGEAELNIEFGSVYEDLGATATDAIDGEIDVVVTGIDAVDTSVYETYTITYTATDSADNTATATRTLTVTGVDTTAPEINLRGAEINFVQSNVYDYEEVTGYDIVDGEVEVTYSGTVDGNTLGVYTVDYTAVDAAGNVATATRTITVIESTAFITTWQTNHPNANYSYSSDENQIKIGTIGDGYNFTIDWGDGTIEENQTAEEDVIHTYETAGTYTIKITGAFPRLYSDSYYSGYDNEKLLSVEQWGNNQWTNMAQAFHSASSVVFNATDIPDLSRVTSMYEMFENAYSFNSDISQWDVSNVTNMYQIFRYAYAFNQDISGWDVSNVSNMQAMFAYAESFNQNIGGWDVSNVTTMEDMFIDATGFNQDIGGWIVANVTDMESMFEGATYFNQDLSQWDVSSVTTMRYMFESAESFNQDLSHWQVLNVTNMNDMFYDAHLSVANYDALLNAWSAQTLQSNVYLGVDSYYSSAGSNARDILDNTHGWTIYDFGQLPEEADIVSPTVSLIGDSEITISIGTDYVELGALSIDDRDGATPVSIITGEVDTSTLGEYTLTYTAKDSAGNEASVTRTINVVVVDIIAPVISLTGESTVTLEQDEAYIEKGATAADERDGSVSVVITGEVDYKTTGTYTITYTATDSAGNSASVTRTVIVPTDTTPPVVTLVGSDVIKLTINTEYTELNATAEDWRDGVIEDVVISGSVNTAILGDYTITYTVTDTAGNEGSITRTVQVLNPDVAQPIITLTGGDTIDWTQGFDYSDLGFAAFDERDGELTVEVTGEIDTTTTGTYTLTYTATDAAGNVTVVTRTINVVAATPFITTWLIPSDSLSLTIPTSGSGYDYSIDWGDGTVEENQTGNVIHTYTAAGQYTVKITGPFPRLYINNNSTYDTKLTSVTAWGNNIWSSMASAFYGATNLTITATDSPVLHQVTSMAGIFRDATSFNSDISDWDVSNVTDMSYMFYNAVSFDQDISSWDVSNVTTMRYMFSNADIFNQDISGWDVSNVTNMFYMFSATDSFNQPIGDWGNKTSNVTSMEGLFYRAGAFNQDLSAWDVSSVTNMDSMFYSATAFNQDLSAWNYDVSNVTDMEEMFRSATNFNGDISEWDVSSVTTMVAMFLSAPAFNQDISQWDVSNVTSMTEMFYAADSFNQDIGEWEVSNVTYMSRMFYDADKFNQDINEWNVSNVTDMSYMFYRAVAFNQPLNNWKDKLFNVQTMNYMFYNASSFNQDITEWNVSNVTNMSGMFRNTDVFNQDIGNWDVSNVTTMSYMFRDALAFNQDISDWNVSNVTTMYYMFDDAVAFNQDISDWNIESVTTMQYMFEGANLSVTNYDALLNAWSAKSVQSNVRLNVNSYYSTSASAARDSLVNTYGWTIVDKGALPTDEADITAPVVTLYGNSTEFVVIDTPYLEQGARAADEIDGAVSVVITGDVDTTVIGDNTVTYTATDAAGNVGTATRTVTILSVDTEMPVISITGDNPLTLAQDEAYVEQGANALDTRDGTLDVVITGNVEDKVTGTYTITYTATDSAGNSTSVDRTVIVPTDTAAPIITLKGDELIKYTINTDSYVELGATAKDWREGTVDVVITGTVDTSTLGDYTITYTAMDSLGNTDSITRTVQILDPDVASPNITIAGGDTIDWTQGYDYQDLGVSAFDTRDGSVVVTTSGTVDGTTTGTYTITYTATDAAGNVTIVTRTVNVVAPTPFITTWQTDAEGGNDSYQSASNQIRIGTLGSGYDFTIDWGDGTVEENQTAGKTHTYAVAGTYTIKITGKFPRLYSDDYYRGYDNAKILSVEQWGNNHWTSMAQAFHSNTNLVINATDKPVLHQVTSMSEMFYSATKVNSNTISDWDVSNVTDMSSAFYNTDSFNQDLSGWDVSNVTNMTSMFFYAEAFNQDISGWDVSNVTSMNNMFRNTAVFNQDISQWDVSNVTGMSGMFYSARLFNQPIGDWGNKVSNVTTMSSMFYNAYAFNQDLSAWDVSSVTSMNSMFYNAYTFNQDLSAWKNDLSNVTNMANMFRNTDSFNEDITDWDVSNVTDMDHMFYDAEAFNQDISQWDVSNVTDMSYMFYNADSFNQNIGEWETSSVTDTSYMFYSTELFNQDISQWDMSNVTNMSYMFANASRFNQSLNEWNVSNVTTMIYLFSGAQDFNQPLDNWKDKLLNVTNMNFMFYDADSFNQDISDWDVSNVTNMYYMFSATDAFNQDVSNWNVSNVTNMSYMFRSAVAFNQDISDWNVEAVTTMYYMFDNANLSVTNYDALLNAWSLQSVQSNVLLNVDSYYSESSSAARDSLVNTYGWTIVDKGALPTDTDDITAPVVTLYGNTTETMVINTSYIELGARAADDRDGTVSVVIGGSIDTTTLGDYPLTYTATDAAGNVGTATRIVSVLSVDTEMPAITLVGDNPLTLAQDEAYVEQGANAVDARDGTLDVVITGDVEDKITGTYTVTYTATDSAGNSTSVDRSIIVPTDSSAPVITLKGDELIKYTINTDAYVEKGATARDWREGIVDVVITGAVDTSTLGDYTITYTATDSSGNSDSITRTVQVLDPDVTAPEIMLAGYDGNDSVIDWTQGYNYEDFGASGYDTRDGTVTVTTSGDVDTTTTGTYTITYTATDAAGNTTTVTRTVNVVAPTPFITVWQTNIDRDYPNYDSDNDQIEIPTTGSGYDFTIDWGDGTIEYNQTAGKTHTYAVAGTYTIKITGQFPRLYFREYYYATDNDKLLSVEQWGNNYWQSMAQAFMDTENMVINATDKPILHQVTSMQSMFEGAEIFNSDISDWDVSNVTNMESMFEQAYRFNQDISGWDVSNVTNMSSMFKYVYDFNQDIGEWDVSNVTNMGSMFQSASSFNHNINDWDVSNVQSMLAMFSSATSYNQPLNNWKDKLFNVTNMTTMFNAAYNFNQDISEWDVSNVTAMASMFRLTRAFNQDLSNWDVSNVTDMRSMFVSSLSFNQDISNWDISNVTTMESMFESGALSVDNYDALLNGWSTQYLQSNSILTNTGYYSDASSSARQSIIDTYGWTITDLGLLPVTDDTTSPVVTLLGLTDGTHTYGTSYTDSGAVAKDDRDGGGMDITVTGTIDPNTLGEQTLTYTATDAAGNVGTATRTVTVE
jgi:surface protein